LDLYPAIDLRGGRCVRLRRGDFDAETVYDDDPLRVARDFADAGATWIHVVDLDAARTGEPVHHDLITEICAMVPARVQTGGGIRDAERAAELLAAGAARVVLGTAAVDEPDLVGTLAAAHPGSIAVGLDARGREVAVEGWQRRSGVQLVDLARVMSGHGAAALVVTEIGRDGTLDGPDLDQLEAVLAVVATPVIASGGVGSLDDLRALTSLNVGGRHLAGVIVGRAIHDRRISVHDALAALAN
jgi:phosphoribosylformimino-5-aminoimidazole carboxamide ribotide isomerase